MDTASNEGINLLKMAVTVLMTVLVVSAMVWIFTRVLDWINNDTSDLNNTMVQVQMDKFYELEDMSDQARGYVDPVNPANNVPGTGNYPLVTVVANTILECQSQDILFYQVFNASTGASLAAYSSANLTEVHITGATQVSNPEDSVATFLMQYAGKRCSVMIIGDGDDVQEFPNGTCAVLISIIP